MKFIDLTGQRFGRLTVIGRIQGIHQTKFRCKCDCGNEVDVFSSNLKKKNGRGTKSCGCFQKEQTIERHSTHGKTNTRLFRTWTDLKRRCENPKRENYQYYGARGIKVCDEWKNNFMNFYNWAMANGYNGTLTIERIDVNGDYEPSNCKWATVKEQNFNKTNNHLIEFNGKSLYLNQWAEVTGIANYTISARLRSGWSVERTLTQPIKKQKNNRQKTS